jgi:hypothetical protein
MPRSFRLSARWIILACLSLASAALLAPFFGGAGAQVLISEPSILPGDLGTFAAAGPQQELRLSKGAESTLAVWSDGRTMLNSPEAGTRSPTNATGDGSQRDVYAARIDQAGRVIDRTPVIVDQGGYTQTDPRVGWNGQNWLVVYTSQKENDYFHYEVRARRVSPAGALLDAEPIILDDDAAFRDTLGYHVTEDGAGNWVVAHKKVLPQEGTSIPVGVAVTRVSNDGALLDPAGGRVIYNHHSQYMDLPKLARAGDRYLLTFYDMISPVGIKGLTYDANFNQLRNGPETLIQAGGGYDLATDGQTWFVTGTGGASGNVQSVYGVRVDRNGDPIDANPIVVVGNVGAIQASTAVCWDGQFYFVAYATSYDPSTQTHLNATDIHFARVSAAGVSADPQGRPVYTGDGNQTEPVIAPGVSGGAQVGWFENERPDVSGAYVSREGAAGPATPIALGERRQTEVRMASSDSGFLAVFRSEISGVSRIMAQHLDAQGNPVDAEPFVVADGAQNNNPSVGWDGTQYLVVWDDVVPLAPGETRFSVSQTFGRVVPASGAPVSPEFYIMDGDSPDAAGLEGQFLVVNIIPKTRQIRRTQVARVSGAGVRLGAPTEVEGVFNFWPRVVAFGGRWFAVWEYHANHDDAPGTIRGTFIETDGAVRTPFVVGDAANDRTPHLAVGGTRALVVWSTGDLYSRLVNADGTSPDGQSVPLVSAAGAQARPAVTWDGDQFVVAWVDHRNQAFPLQPRGDVFAARVSGTNVKLEEFAVADSPLPEDTPFVISAGGLSVFSYAKFYGGVQTPDGRTPAAHRITLRKSDLPAPAPGALPAAPSNLSATQINQGVGSVTLAWNDNSDNETGFKIESRTGAGAWTQVRLVGAGTTGAGGFTVGVNESTAFRVRAYNTAGNSDYTNEASAPVAKLNYFNPPTYTEPANVNVSATASDPEGVARVEFHVATDATYPKYTLLATDTQAPYAYDWANVPRGYYYVKAKAVDNQGSTTETLYESFVVYGTPSATITSPAGGASFQPGASVTIKATPQTNNTDQSVYVNRMDFYANTTLVGSVQGYYSEYSFTWSNVPAGAYSLTARPTTNNNLTGNSAPVQITVGSAGANISGRVTAAGGAPLYNVRVSLTGSQTGSATTDTEGNYVLPNVAPGGNYTVTPSASGYTFSPASRTYTNLTGGQQAADFAGTAGQPAPADPNAQPIYAQPYDGRGVEGPSTRIPAGQRIDKEVADDFDMAASITRVVVRGSRGGYNMPPNPVVYGAFVRFYAWSDGKPGALQAEHYCPRAAPASTTTRRSPTPSTSRCPRPSTPRANTSSPSRPSTAAARRGP